MPTRRLGTLRAIALAVAVVLGLGITPAPLKSAVASGVMAVSNRLFSTVGTVAVPPKTADPIREAVLNVTTDFDELTHLVAEFMRTQTEQSREQFKQFMADRATRSYPRLEGLLDWLLSLYKFIFPFLIISMVAKHSGNGGKEEGNEYRHLGHTVNAELGGEGEKHGSPHRPAMALLQHRTSSDGGGGGSTRRLGGQLAAGAAGVSGGTPKALAGGSAVASIGRMPSRAMACTQSPTDVRRPSTPAPSTPIERNARLPLHPAQLQGATLQRHRQPHQHQHQEIFATTQ